PSILSLHDLRALPPPHSSPTRRSSDLIGPVRVFDHEQEPALSRRHGEQRHDRLEEPQLRLARVASPRVLAALSELRKELRQLLASRAEQRAESFGVLARKVVPDRLHDRQVRQRKLGLTAPAREDGAVEPACALRK